MLIGLRQLPINPGFGCVLVFVLLMMPATGSALKGASAPWLRKLCDGDGGITPQRPEQVIRYGMTSTAYQSLLDTYAPLGYEAVWVDGYNVGPNVFFNAILNRRASRPWATYFNQTGDAFLQTLREKIDEGFRLVHVDMYPDNGQLLYASIFIDEPDTVWFVSFGQTIDHFNEEFDGLIDEGYRIANLVFVEVGGTLFVTTLYDQEPVGRWVAAWGMTADEYDAELDAQRDEGLLLHYLHGYDLNGEPRFIAAWDERPYGRWQTKFHLSAQQLQAEIDAAVDAGRRTRFLAGYRNGKAANFSGLWTEE